MKKVNPLLVFTGLALASLAALAGVTYDRWSPQESSPEALLAQAQSNAPAADKGSAPSIGGQDTVVAKNEAPQPVEKKTELEKNQEKSTIATATSPEPDQSVPKTVPEPSAAPQPTMNEKTAVGKEAPVPGNKDESSVAAGEPANIGSKPSGLAEKPPEVSGSGQQLAKSTPESAPATDEVGKTPEVASSVGEIKVSPPPNQQAGESLQTNQNVSKAAPQGPSAADGVAEVPKETEAAPKQMSEPAPSAGQVAEAPMPQQNSSEPPPAKSGTLEKLAAAPEATQNVPKESSNASLSNDEKTGADGAAQKVKKVSPESPPTVQKKPSFDTVRVETTGEAVAAGEAAPGSEITLKLDGRAIGKTTTNEDGSWVIVPDKPLAPGAGALSVEQKQQGQARVVESDQTIAVLVPPKPNSKPMVALVEPDAPVRIIQTPQQEKPAAIQGKVALDSIDYNDDGDILFSGRAEAGAAVRLYIDNRVKGDAVADASGRWFFTGRADIPAGTHALRVDRIDTGGKVMSRIELPFVREEASKVAAMIAPPPVSIGKPEPDATVKQDSAATVSEPKVAESDASTETGKSQPEAVAKPQPEVTPPAAKSDRNSAPAAQDKASDQTAQSNIAPLPPPKAEEELASNATPELLKKNSEIILLKDSSEQTAQSNVAPPPPPKAEEELASNATPEVLKKDSESVLPKDSSKAQVAAAAPAETAEAPRQGHIVIQPGNNLWKLSRIIYGRGTHYTIIYQANKGQIRNPGRIYPGQIFTTPNALPPDKIDPKRKEPLTPAEGGTTPP